MSKITNVELKVVGVTFKNEDGTDRQDVIRNLTNEASILLVREPHNKFDRNAVMVFANLRQIGYIGKEFAKILAPKMDAGAVFNAKIKDVGEYEKTQYCHIIINEA